MDWSALAGPVIKLGGTVIGSMLGAPGLGATAGQILASTLGVEPTPEAVGKAIERASPETLAAVRQADAEAEKQWAKTAATQSKELNETMRAEIAAGVSWWHWRHLLGYVVGGWVAGIAAAFVKLMWIADAVQIANVAQLLNSGFGYFGAACGLLGYIAMDTTRRTAAAATGNEIPTIVGTLMNAIRKK